MKLLTTDSKRPSQSDYTMRLSNYYEVLLARRKMPGQEIKPAAAELEAFLSDLLSGSDLKGAREVLVEGSNSYEQKAA